MTFPVNRDDIPIEEGFDSEAEAARHARVTGYEARDYSAVPVGSVEYETPFDDALELMSVEEIIECIRRQEAEESSLWHVWERAGKIETNQGQLGYCHAFSPKGAMLILRARDGLDVVDLSGSSVGAPVTGYANRGAPIYRDLKQACEVGFATTDFVPDRTTSRRDFKPGWEANAARHRFAEWITGDGSRNPMRGLHQQLTAACRKIPGCNGLNYWGHAVTDLRFVLTREPAGVRTIEQLMPCLAVDFLNSWRRTYGKDGIGRRVGRKMIADQIYFPTVPTPSAKL